MSDNSKAASPFNVLAAEVAQVRSDADIKRLAVGLNALEVAQVRSDADMKRRAVGLNALPVIAEQYPDIYDNMTRTWPDVAVAASFLTATEPLSGRSPLEWLAEGKTEKFRQALGTPGEFGCS